LSTASLRLRHALIPYLYTMNRRNHVEHLPLVQPIYHNWPDAEESWHVQQEYTFGTELLIAPYTSKSDPDTRLSRQVVWFPDVRGGWTDFFTGEHYPGGQWSAVYGDLDHIPVFAKAGAIVPLNGDTSWGSLGNPTLLDVHLFAGASNRFVLFEDDGVTLNSSSVETEMVLEQQAQMLTFEIKPAIGDVSHIPADREAMLFVHGIAHSEAVQLTVDGEAVDAEIDYDGEAEMMVIGPVACSPTANMQLTINAERDPETSISLELFSRRDRTAEKLYSMIAQFKAETAAKNELAQVHHLLQDQPELLGGFLMNLTDSHLQALCETIYQAGFHTINYGNPESTIQMWNNRKSKEVTFVFTKHNTIAWPWGRNTANHGFVPQSKAWLQSHQSFNEVGWPGPLDWQMRIDYGRMFAHKDEFRTT
ncbi:MAG: hypothetical protein AAGD96_20835, partial [Chloroflexota bacterium]